MKMEASTKTGVVLAHLCHCLRELSTTVSAMAGTATKLARDDPRRVTHSLKVGLALTLVSITYYLQPIYDNFKETAIWTVMTVVVVFEFTVGGTLSKGLNRAAATFVAGGLGLGAHRLASLAGRIPESVLLTIFVFLIATALTFIRFVPKIKAKYDYGVLIFLLTFCLISVSGFQEEDVLKMTYNRVSTVFMGGAVCVVVSVGICPVWAGENLHNLIALNIQKLGSFLEGFGDEYFKPSLNGEYTPNVNLEGYQSLLVSKSSEDSMAILASWEPRHGKFMFRHPWKQYLKLGEIIRQCAYRIDALHAHLNDNKKIPLQMEESCKNISSETGKALKEISVAVKTMTRQRHPDIHLNNARKCVVELKSHLQDHVWMQDEDFLSILPCGTVASLLIDVVDCTEKVAEAVNELARLVNFKPERRPSARIEPTLNDSSRHVVVDIVDEHSVSTLPEKRSVHAAPADSSVNAVDR